ncbi:MAG: DUF2325 domain-containing protein [Nitrospirae bacterium]|nr:DUF2325 domain-containing protein [Nitrospirota bacterium]
MISTVPHRIRRPLPALEDFICPIIGTCLTLKELKKIAMRFVLKEEMTPYALHTSMIQAYLKERSVAKYIQKYLNGKYWLIMRRIDRFEGKDLFHAWQEAVKDGEIAGAFWAIMTRADAPPSVTTQVFGDVHMMSHLQGSERRAEAKEMAGLRDEVSRLKEEKDRLFREINKVRDERDQAKKDKSQMEYEVTKLKGEIRLMKERLTYLEEGQKLQRLREENSQLREKLINEEDLRKRLERRLDIIQEKLRSPVPTENFPERLPQFTQEDRRINLCKRRILYVGGMDRLEHHCRDLVEKEFNGIFEHHNGDWRNGQVQLEEMIRRTEIVLCPVNCNSHWACLCVKKLCKELNKPFIMLQSSGLGSLKRAISQFIEAEIEEGIYEREIIKNYG